MTLFPLLLIYLYAIDLMSSTPFVGEVNRLLNSLRFMNFQRPYKRASQMIVNLFHFFGHVPHVTGKCSNFLVLEAWGEFIPQQLNLFSLTTLEKGKCTRRWLDSSISPIQALEKWELIITPWLIKADNLGNRSCVAL